MREDDLDYFKGFVAATRWRFAKTYVESYPHEYTLRQWVDTDAFSRAIQCIEQRGRRGVLLARRAEVPLRRRAQVLAHGQCGVRESR